MLAHMVEPVVVWMGKRVVETQALRIRQSNQHEVQLQYSYDSPPRIVVDVLITSILFGVWCSVDVPVFVGKAFRAAFYKCAIVSTTLH